MPRGGSNTTVLQLLAPDTSVGWDPDAFDELIRTHGVRMVHFRSMRCPIGMTDRTDGIRGGHDPESHPDCSNSFIYTRGGKLTCWFGGNGLEYKFEDVQRLDDSTVQVTLPRFYDDQPGVEPEVAPCDRFYLDEERITVVHWETVEYSASGVDRLSFPAVSVTDLVDNQGLWYRQGVDFLVNERGRIAWQQGGNRPGMDPRTQKGRIYSVRYRYRPFWYCTRIPHEVRIAQIPDPLGDTATVRMPLQLLLQREYVFENEEHDEVGPNRGNPRQIRGPADGGFGAK